MESESILVDHFNQKKTTNALGGVTSVFSDAQGGRVVPSFSLDDAVGKGHVLALVYDVAQAGSYAGYVSALPHLDLRGYHTLTFFVKGHEGAQDLLVSLRDRSGHERKVLLSVYLPQKITTSWQQVTLPLTAFSQALDWSAIDSLSLSFEHALHTAGTVFVDAIAFHKNLQFVLVEDFERTDEKNLLGGKHGTFVHGAAAVNGAFAKSPHTSIYGISYGGNIGDVSGYDSGLNYAGWTTELEGIDCAHCGTLSFRIRGAAGEEQPNIYLDDGNFRWGVDIEKYAKVTTSWQRVTIPLSEFADYGVDLTHLAGLQIVFEWKKMSGTIYLDDIQFGSPAQVMTQVTPAWQKE